METTMIYNPLEEFEKKFKNLHLEYTQKHFETLVQKSGVNIEENRKTVKEYNDLKINLSKLKRKLRWWKFLRVILYITLLLIPLVILKITPKIKAMKSEIEQADKKIEQLFVLAQNQMQPLNRLFEDSIALKIIENTIPMLNFAPCFSVEQETDMIINYDFNESNSAEQSTIDVLAGRYNDNPFLFENKRVHRMGVEVYHGYKTITWTEHYRDANGRSQTRLRSETLHATVSKPKPFYSTQVVLNYCAQGGPELSFSRDATNLHRKNDKQIERYVRRGEKKLKKMNAKALKKNKEFVSMSNSDFEVLFDALDRTDEVEFRTLFTPLAQTNMVDLIRSQAGYGDDFNFIKRKRTNKIISQHSQGRLLNLPASAYFSHSFEEVRQNFIGKNAEYFKAIYFDFAPLWAVPMYQDKPVHSLQPVPALSQKYSCKEYEILSNRVGAEHVVHAQTKTEAILKSAFIGSKNGVDEMQISAYSYDSIPRVDYVTVHGGDGHWHSVAVEWDEYIPLEQTSRFFVAPSSVAPHDKVIAMRNDLCIFK